MNGRTVAVTGANSGLGLATSEALCRQGARVLMLCRSADKGAAAVEMVSRDAAGSAELIVCDLEHRDQIAEAAAEVQRRTTRLDVLVNNAGLYQPTHRFTEDGLERTFAVNHLGPFRLTRHLLPLLVASAPSRIVTVSSRSHAEGSVDFADLQRTERSYGGYRAYSDSKLCNILFTRELARRLQGHDVHVSCVHPGVIATGFAQDEPGFLQRLFLVAKGLMTRPDKGADTQVWLASGDDVPDVAGGYFVKRRLVTPSRAARSDDDAARLWRVSEGLAGPLPEMP